MDLMPAKVEFKRPQWKTFEDTLREGGAADLPMLDELASHDESRLQIRKATSNPRIMSSSVGIYPGEGKTNSLGRNFALRRSIEDTYGTKNGQKVILDLGSIPMKAIGAEGRPFIFYSYIAPGQVTVTDERIILAPDPKTAVVIANFPWQSGLTNALVPILGNGMELMVYNDPKATRVGPIHRAFDIEGQFERDMSANRLKVYANLLPGTHDWIVKSANTASTEQKEDSESPETLMVIKSVLEKLKTGEFIDSGEAAVLEDLTAAVRAQQESYLLPSTG